MIYSVKNIYPTTLFQNTFVATNVFLLNQLKFQGIVPKPGICTSLQASLGRLEDASALASGGCPAFPLCPNGSLG